MRGVGLVRTPVNMTIHWAWDGHILRGAVPAATPTTSTHWASGDERDLVPDPKIAVPTASADGHAVVSDAQAAHPIFVGRQHAQSCVNERVPHVAVEVIVTREQESAALAEAHGRDPTDDVLMAVVDQLLVRSDVEQAAGCVIAARRKGHSVGEEGDGIDVRVVAGEGLFAHAVPNVPQLCTRITRTCRESPLEQLPAIFL